MKFKIVKEPLQEMKTDALILWHFRGDETLSAPARQINEACGGVIENVLAKGDFEGKKKETLLLYPGPEIAAPRLVLTGLGERGSADADAIRIGYGEAVRKLRGLKVKSLGTCLNFNVPGIEPGDAASAALEGIILSDYHYRQYKTDDPEGSPIEITAIAGGTRSEAASLAAGIEAAGKIGAAVCFARDLGNSPANGLTPDALAGIAAKAARSRKIKCTVYDRERIRKAGMTALLGVAQGSREPPRFIVLEYYGARAGRNNIVLVGKGITFDSGGISLKPVEKMGEMKADMAGAAAVIGAVCAAADLKLSVNVIGLIPATENMPGGGAFRPGDILKSLKGTTIEIVTTDAEGRLILADALAYAQRFNPAVVIDVATLTGACVIALGEEVAGLFGNDEDLKRRLTAASRKSGEKIWEMPLWECYGELNKSDVADLKNSGGRNGGAIIAAAFLNRFAGDVPWAHLDIAGPGFSNTDKPCIPKGATGFGVRLLTRFLMDCSEGVPRRKA